MKEKYIEIEKIYSSKHLMVLGDVMLDKYIWGTIDRISPEAPVPVVHVENVDYHAGGAANVARNISGLGGRVSLVGLIGEGPSGSNLKTILAEVREINRASKEIILDSKEVVSYDKLIISAGSSYSYFGNNEWSNFSKGLKVINDALDIREKILKAFEKAENEKDENIRKKYLNFVIIGGGPTGVELAGSISEIAYKNMTKEFRNFNSSDANIYLLEAGERILPTYSESLSQKSYKYLTDFGVKIRIKERVVNIEEMCVTTDKTQ